MGHKTVIPKTSSMGMYVQNISKRSNHRHPRGSSKVLCCIKPPKLRCGPVGVDVVGKVAAGRGGLALKTDMVCTWESDRAM
jgi:hypothetical protein